MTATLTGDKNYVTVTSQQNSVTGGLDFNEIEWSRVMEEEKSDAVEGDDEGFKLHTNRRRRRKLGGLETARVGRQLITREAVSEAVKRAQKNSFIGRNDGGTLQAAQRFIYKWYFVSRLEKTITSEGIRVFLEAQQPGNYVVEELTPKYDGYKSFKIGVPFKSAGALMSPDVWPYGVFINRFYFSRGKPIDRFRPQSEEETVGTDFT